MDIELLENMGQADDWSNNEKNILKICFIDILHDTTFGAFNDLISLIPHYHKENGVLMCFFVCLYLKKNDMTNNCD